MEKLWLYPENETPFVFNESKSLIEKEEKIKANKAILDEYAKRNRTVGDMDENILGGISAVAVEKESFRKEVEAGTISNTNLQIIDGFIEAQNILFNRLEKEPYLYPELFVNLHSYLVKDNLDISDYDKGHFRDKWSKEIQVGYFSPTPGAEVGREMSYTFTQYAFVDRSGKDNVFEKIAKLHAQIVRIQPFMDGNKRTAFLVTNGMLKLHGLPAIDFCSGAEEVTRYNNSLKTAIVKRDVSPLAELIADKVLTAQDRALDKLAIEEVKDSLNDMKNKTIESNQKSL